MSGRLEQLAATVAAIADELGAEANVRAARTRHGLTRFANSAIHQHVGEDTTTVALTLAVDGRTSTASTTTVDEASLRALVERTVASARLQPVDAGWPGAASPVSATEVDGQDRADSPASGDPGEAGQHATEPEARARLVADFVAAGRELEAAGYVDTEADEVAFASTAGRRVAGASTRATVDGIHQTATSAGSAHQTSRHLAELDARAVGAVAAARARRPAELADLDPGPLPVVLCPEAVATLLTFLAFYGFNAKSHLDGSSFVRLREAQLDEDLAVLAGPTDPRAVGLGFDAEGTPRRRYPLIEAGVTRSLAHDRRTAKRADASTTGNAVPGGEAFGALPLNVVLPGGTTPASELVAGLERGLLVTAFHYCRVLDPKTLAVSGLTRNGTFLVEDGEVAGAVGNLRFTQSFVDAFAPGRLVAVGDDDRYAAGEFGPGMIICPSLSLARWNFTGGVRG